MKVHFSDFFNVSPEIVEKYGAVNISLINDFPLFVDPFLLFYSKKKNYNQLHGFMVEYIRFLRDVVADSPDVSMGVLKHLFYFPEVKQNWLGYSRVGNGGNGPAKEFALHLSSALKTYLRSFGKEQITRGSHLEKVALFKDGFGKDYVSDFTVNLIKPYLMDYSQRFAQKYLDKQYIAKITIQKCGFSFKNGCWLPQTFLLPFSREINDYVILTPRDILTKDETWINKFDLYNGFATMVASMENSELRSKINLYLNEHLKRDATDEERHGLYGKLINIYPEIADYYIAKKEATGDGAQSSSRIKVLLTEIMFVENLKKLLALLESKTAFYMQEGNSYQAAYDRVVYLKNVVENMGGHRFFFVGDEPIRRESDLRVLYRLTWYGTTYDVGTEVNDGRGPCDFKISKGKNDKDIVEFKLASNTSLEKNLKNQVAIYEKASETTYPSIKVIFYFSEKEYIRVKDILGRLGLQNDKNVILVDASPDKPSASVA